MLFEIFVGGGDGLVKSEWVEVEVGIRVCRWFGRVG